MTRTDLTKKFPPSQPCRCNLCRSYCLRPGWWTVRQAENAIRAGYAERMMLEMSPELTFGVLSPAFKGNEGNISLEIFARSGCTFLINGLCELFGTDLEPVECLYCHHSRPGAGERCHRALEKDWCTKKGQKLVIYWGNKTGIFERNGIFLNQRGALDK